MHLLMPRWDWRGTAVPGGALADDQCELVEGYGTVIPWELLIGLLDPLLVGWASTVYEIGELERPTSPWRAAGDLRG